MRIIFALLVLLSIIVSPSQGANGRATSESALDVAIVHNPNPEDRLNLRTKPDKTSESLGKYYSGTQVEILETVNAQWAKVRIGYTDCGYREGYMMRDFLAQGAAGKAVMPALPMMRNMKESFFALYVKPSHDAAKVQHLESGDIIFEMTFPITVLGDLPNGWCHVSMEGSDWNNPRADESGTVIFTGFIKRDQLSPLNENLGSVSNAAISYMPDGQQSFTEAELDAAVAVIKKQFEMNYVGCELTRLWYDEAESNEFLSNESKMEISPQYIVFLSDFDCVTSYQATGFEEGPVRRWTWFLYRADTDSDWQIVSWGLF